LLPGDTEEESSNLEIVIDSELVVRDGSVAALWALKLRPSLTGFVPPTT
jgi:hypothetical protein